MHRFYIRPEDWHADAPVLMGGEAHHCRNVLRLDRGDKVVVFDGRGRELTAEIASIDTAEIQLRKLHEAQTPPLRCRITLGQAIPKGKNMDLIVQKAVEIGAAEIAPILSDRTVVRLDDESAISKQAKWQTVAIEAAKQCGQNWLPQVQTPQSLAQFFADHRRFDLQLIGSLQSDAVHLKNILAEYAAEHSERPSSVLMLVGPEGDFTPAELSLARSQGCRPITLGPVVLRVETASIYCLSILSYELLV
ncbi:MAG: 16S rRNA (uracil(1498)-N(3))-methyltransferase [Chthoniobacterales bacterium]|nr:MAG: 16S rRNA (uracil(1498)-N(3))-methyltransferase [Chthoniobacterales bacterium]